MPNYDADYISQKARELGFIRDTFEKVMRLSDILEYFNMNPMLKERLGLKGGTAINLTILNLPRLSVDIDLDYLVSDSRDEMLESREEINSNIRGYMLSQGYSESPKTKLFHSLDSWNYNYTGVSGNNDRIKLEINYSLRSHLFPTEERLIIPNHFSNEYKVKTLAPLEIFGSKINALLHRAATRDLYDINNMINFELFSDKEKILLKKSVIFYAAISSKTINKAFDTSKIDAIVERSIKTELRPVINNRDTYDLDISKKLAKEYISDMMILDNDEKRFLDNFEEGKYVPELLFTDPEILKRIKNHPMALWKTQRSQ